MMHEIIALKNNKRTVLDTKGNFEDAVTVAKKARASGEYEIVCVAERCYEPKK